VSKVVPPTVPAPVTPLTYDGVNWNALLSDVARHLQVDVIASGLPAGGATAAHQLTMITALQLIDDLRAALESVGTDRLRVRGEDQLISYKGALLSMRDATISGAGGYVESETPPAGEIWKVANILTFNVSTATTAHDYYVDRAGDRYWFSRITAAMAAGVNSEHHGEIWLDPGDVVRIYYAGALVDDLCYIILLGHIMTVES